MESAGILHHHYGVGLTTCQARAYNAGDDTVHMREIPSWDTYYLDICRVVATRSKDPNTQIGCVIVGTGARDPLDGV